MSIGSGEVADALLALLAARLQPVLADRGLPLVETWLTVPAYVARVTDFPIVAVHGGNVIGLERDDALTLDARLAFTVTAVIEGDSEDHAAVLSWDWQKALIEVLLHYPLDVAGVRCHVTVGAVDTASTVDTESEPGLAGWDVRLTVLVPEAYDPSVDPLNGPAPVFTAEDLIVTTPLLDVEV